MERDAGGGGREGFVSRFTVGFCGRGQLRERGGGEGERTVLEQDLGPYELLVLSFEVLSSDSRVRRRVIDPLSTEGSARTEEGGGDATDEELEVGDGLVGLGFNVEAKVEREVGDLLELAGGARGEEGRAYLVFLPLGGGGGWRGEGR